MAKTVVVKQNPDEEVPTEVLADAVVAISQGIKKLRSGRLNDRALVLLITDAAPTTKKGYQRISVRPRDVRAVLDGIESLEAAFIRKPGRPA